MKITRKILADASRDSEPNINHWCHPLVVADSITFLQHAFDKRDQLYIGPMAISRKKQAEHIRTASEWIKIFKFMLRQKAEPVIMGHNFQMCCANPLDGEPTGTGSVRSDANVAKYKYSVIEHDEMGIGEQVELLKKLRLPIVAMVFSGGKSVHALIDVEKYARKKIRDKNDWDGIIKYQLFECELSQYGFDRTTCNPSRMIRMPGMYRKETDDWQRLLYIKSATTQ